MKSSLRRHGLAARAAVWVALLGLGLGLRILFFTISVKGVQPYSDESMAMLQAQDVLHGHFPLLLMAQPYMFPLESYIVAPFTPLLPLNAFGARLVPFLVNLLGLALWLIVLRRVAKGPAILVGAALVLVPSCYWLMLQSAMALPGYTALIVLFAACALAADQARRSERSRRWLLLTGFLAALAFSGHMLALPYALAAIAYAGLVDQPRNWARLPPLVLGALAGLLPFLLALHHSPDAHAAVASHRPVLEAVRRLWQPTLDHTALGAFGIVIPPFPDLHALPAVWPAMKAPFAVLLVALVLGLVAWRVAHTMTALFRRRPPYLELVDVFLTAIVLNIALFAASKRGDSTNYRYLLISVACFPMLLAWLATRGAAWFAVAGAIVAALVVVNIASTRRLIAEWREPDFAAERCTIPDLGPALLFLERNGFTHAVAAYNAAYRITYQTDRRIVCSQPFNERFPDWPLPYKKETDGDPHIAYVLSDNHRFLTASLFARQLAQMGVACSIYTAGDFRVFHDFRAPEDLAADTRLSPEDVHFAGHPPLDNETKLSDGKATTFWTTPGKQHGDEWIEATWPAPVVLHRAIMVYGGTRQDYPARLAVLVKEPDGWRFLYGSVPASPDPFEVRMGRPVYGRTTHTFDLDGVKATGVRFECIQARTNWNWTVAELEIYGEEAPAPEGAR